MLKKYSLSSEIQLFKVGQISEIFGKSPDPRQLWLGESAKSVQSHSFTDIEPAESDPHFFVPRDIGAEYLLEHHIWSA